MTVIISLDPKFGKNAWNDHSVQKSSGVIVTPPVTFLRFQKVFSLLIHVLVCVLFQVFVYMYTISQPWFCSAPDNYPPCWYPDEYGTYENRTIDDVIPNPNNGTIPAFPISLTENECDTDSEVEEEYHVEFYGATALFLFSQFQECFIN